MSGKPWSELFPICFFYDIAFNPPKNNTEAYQFWLNQVNNFHKTMGYDLLNSTSSAIVLNNFRSSPYNPVNIRQNMLD